MLDIVKVFGWIGLGLFLVILVVLIAMNANLFRGVAKQSKIGKADIRSYAKRYMRKFPESNRTGLREALLQEFVPERVLGRDTDKELLGCLLFGIVGMIASAVAQSTAADMGDAEIRRIKQLIDDVTGDLSGEMTR